MLLIETNSYCLLEKQWIESAVCEILDLEIATVHRVAMYDGFLFFYFFQNNLWFKHHNSHNLSMGLVHLNHVEGYLKYDVGPEINVFEWGTVLKLVCVMYAVQRDLSR